MKVPKKWKKTSICWVLTNYFLICWKSMKFKFFCKFGLFINELLKEYKNDGIMDSIWFYWWVGYREMIKKRIFILGHVNPQIMPFLSQWLFHFFLSFCKKQAFFQLPLSSSSICSFWWFQNIDFQKVCSISSPLMYNMSIFMKIWSFQIFFTEKCPLSCREYLVSWTLS